MASDTLSRKRRRIAFLLPVFNEAQSIAAFHAALQATAQELEADHDIQFVYVDDGSRDDSLALAPSLPFRRAAHRAGLTALLGHAVDQQAGPLHPTRLPATPAR